MTRFQIQVLRYINLSGGHLSARTLGLYGQELAPLVGQGLVEFGANGYAGGSCKVSDEGQELLRSLDADRFANPLWDDEVFLSLMSRTSLHRKRGAK
jgi:hypothetical protein